MRVLLKVAITIVVAVSPASMLLADQPKHDWKYLGSTGNENDLTHFFFLPSEAQKLADNHLQVWTKQIGDKKLESAYSSISKHKDLVEQAATKVAAYYIPPVAVNENLTTDRITDIIAFEVIADSQLVRPDITILYELDCSGRQYRELSIARIKKNDEVDTWEGPAAWKHAAPDTVIDELFLLECSAK